jgi:hypothetical protein
MMKRILQSLIFLLLLLQCTNRKAEPDQIALKFLKLIHQHKFKEAGVYVSNYTKTDFRDFTISGAKFDTIDTLMIQWVDKTKAGDTVHYQYVIDSTLSDTLDLLLLKKSGVWRVAFQRTDPVGIAYYFLKAFQKGDLKTASQYVTIMSKPDLNIFEEVFKGWTGPDVEMKGVDINKDSDEAVVTYFEMGNDREKFINLVRQHGRWKVTFTKLSHPDYFYE